MLFDGVDSSGHDNLWVTNGTAAGTSELNVAGASLSGLFSGGFEPEFTVLGSKGLFRATDSSGNINLWVTDSTAAGTSELSVAGASSSGLFPFDFTVFGRKVLFDGIDSSGNRSLWVTDGTAAGTSELRVAGASSSGFFPSEFTVFGTKVLFDGTDSSGNSSLWVTDGTAAGTSELSAAGASSSGFDPGIFTVFGREVLFHGFDSSGDDNLWVTDGTAAGTSELSVAGASATGLAPGGFTVFQAPCFQVGTRIRTKCGNVAVEDLRIGDNVLVAGGAARPIVWIGQRRVDCRRHPQPDLVWPVRIRAGAFGDGLPQRDLWLSPDHAVFCDGVLIPVKYLVNGATILQEKAASVLYFHVELDRHDVLLAEGLPTESYLDTGNRAQFANGAAHMTLHPDFSPLSWDAACAPLCTGGPLVLVARRRLRERMIAATGLHVMVAARAIHPAAVRGRLHQFLLPAAARQVRIVSRTGIPAEMEPRRGRHARRDCRRLGVCVGGIVLDGRLLALDDCALGAGFHAVEQHGRERWRWTDGDAALDLPPRDAPCVLELLLRDTKPNRELAHSAGGVPIAA